MSKSKSIHTNFLVFWRAPIFILKLFNVLLPIEVVGVPEFYMGGDVEISEGGGMCL